MDDSFFKVNDSNFRISTLYWSGNLSLILEKFDEKDRIYTKIYSLEISNKQITQNDINKLVKYAYKYEENVKNIQDMTNKAIKDIPNV